MVLAVSWPLTDQNIRAKEPLHMSLLDVVVKIGKLQ